MTDAIRTQDWPYATEVEEGKTYYYCACGRSKNQPFCDGSHSGTDFTPISYTAEKSDTVYFCACRESKSKPFCDGSHNK